MRAQSDYKDQISGWLTGSGQLGFIVACAVVVLAVAAVLVYRLITG